jgi:hypothetical protein
MICTSQHFFYSRDTFNMHGYHAKKYSFFYNKGFEICVAAILGKREKKYLSKK